MLVPRLQISANAMAMKKKTAKSFRNNYDKISSPREIQVANVNVEKAYKSKNSFIIRFNNTYIRLTQV